MISTLTLSQSQKGNGELMTGHGEGQTWMTFVLGIVKKPRLSSYQTTNPSYIEDAISLTMLQSH